MTMKAFPALLSITATIWFASPSSADPGDASFVSQLDRAGIELSDPPSLVGNLARNICGLLENNWTIGTAKYAVLAEYPDLSDTQTRQFVVLAMRNYCPGVGS